MSAKNELLKKRDAKTFSHLVQYAPVWIVDEQVNLQDEAVQFNVVFQHNQYGWVNRRYRFDAFNNVLYHKGQTAVSEEAMLEIQEQTPYIPVVVADIPNAYGG